MKCAIHLERERNKRQSMAIQKQTCMIVVLCVRVRERGWGWAHCFENSVFTASHVAVHPQHFHIAHRPHSLAAPLRQRNSSYLHALVPRLCFGCPAIGRAVRDYDASATIHLACDVTFAAAPQHVQGELDEGGGCGQLQGAGAEGDGRELGAAAAAARCAYHLPDDVWEGGS